MEILHLPHAGHHKKAMSTDFIYVSVKLVQRAQQNAYRKHVYLYRTSVRLFP